MSGGSGAGGVNRSLFYGVGFLSGVTQESHALDVTSATNPVVVGSSGYNEFVENGITNHHQGQPFRWGFLPPKPPPPAAPPGWTPVLPPLQQLAVPAIDKPGGQALAISDDGKIIVGYSYYRQTPTGELGFLGSMWQQQSGWSHQGIQPAPGYIFARAVGYADSGGRIVGYSKNDGSSTGPRHGTMWNGPGAAGVLLPENIAGATVTSTWPTAISDKGKTIVGTYRVNPTGLGPDLPCVWRGVPGNIQVSALPMLPNASSGLAVDVSRNGNAIVGACLDASGDFIACTWTRSGPNYLVQAIPSIPFTGTSIAMAISRDGDVIVGYTSTVVGDDYIPQPWIWSSGKGIRPLIQALQSEGVTTHAGWSRLQPEELSDDGRNIVGFGTNPQGAVEGWVARLRHP